MKLKGILDFSLGNFLCLRGFAPLGELSENTRPDESYQRKPVAQQEKQLKRFLEEGRYTFFPELILGVSLEDLKITEEKWQTLLSRIRSGTGFPRQAFGDLTISVYVATSKGNDPRSPKFHITATLEGFDGGKDKVIFRIDGNHRLLATATAKDAVKKYQAPYCLVLFRNTRERDEFSRVFFHNINFKALPLTREKNLELILDDDSLFPDETLKTDESFGWPYYHARKLHGKLDLILLSNIAPFLKDEPRSVLLRQLKFLIARGVLNDNENAIKRLTEALGKTNSLFDTFPSLKESHNRELIDALVYFQLAKPSLVPPFVRWVLSNHLHYIKESHADDLIGIFERVLDSRKRTIFVSMPFGKDTTENHYKTIQRVAEAINADYPDLKPPLKVERVDFLQSGTSFPIRAKIDEFMANCGLLIGDLTYCNANVYHEIGFMDGKAKAEGMEPANVLLFLDESVAEEKDKAVGFNLRGTKHIPFKQSEEFANALRQNLEAFFKLKSV